MTDWSSLMCDKCPHTWRSHYGDGCHECDCKEIGGNGPTRPSIVTVEIHAGECFRCPGAATWYWHGEEDPGAFTVACEICGETTFGAGEGRIK